MDDTILQLQLNQNMRRLEVNNNANTYLNVNAPEHNLLDVTTSEENSDSDSDSDSKMQI